MSVSVADEGNLLSEIQKSKTSHFLVAEEAGEDSRDVQLQCFS